MNEELEYVRLSCADAVCTLLKSKEYFYRGVQGAAGAAWGELLASGLLQELYQRDLIPKTARSERPIAGFELVIEQERVTPVVYPYEWSPEMLRRAALCTLKVNQCANEFGYELKDAHPFNIVFRRAHPLFVDIGSFVKISRRGFWGAAEEFRSSFESTLHLVQMGNLEVFRHAFLLSGLGFPRHALFALRHPVISRCLGPIRLRKLFYAWSMYRIGPTISTQAIDEKFAQPWQRKLARWVLHLSWAPFRRFSHERMLKRISRYRLTHATNWGTYQERSGLMTTHAQFNLSARYAWVVQKAVDLAPYSILEIAGNQGVLSRVLAAKLPQARVICSDYDTQAIDHLVLSLRPEERVQPLSFDLMRDARESVMPERTTRLRSELVIALALTHHLVLSQGFALAAILRTLATYSARYLMIEFMPLGLWSEGQAPAVPKWYNEKWFTDELKRFFAIMHRQELEANRVLFVCQKINWAQSSTACAVEG